jgi:hypothetical protein
LEDVGSDGRKVTEMKVMIGMNIPEVIRVSEVDISNDRSEAALYQNNEAL